MHKKKIFDIENEATRLIYIILYMKYIFQNIMRVTVRVTMETIAFWD